jgi:hypothetical protein
MNAKLRRVATEVRVWHETEMPTALRDVRSQEQSGKHLLTVSSSQFDPMRTSAARTAEQNGLENFRGDSGRSLLEILDSVRQLLDAKMAPGPRSRLERHNRFADEVIK